MTRDGEAILRPRILFLGLGGGSDILFAYGLSRVLPARDSCEAIWANTKKQVEDDFQKIGSGLYRLPGGTPLDSPLGPDAHSTTEIDRRTPRGPAGCPWIFIRPAEDESDAIAKEQRKHGIDIIVGVDAGGDVLTDPRGRDARMLRHIQKLGVPIYLAIVGPGCDGDSTEEALLRELNELEYQGKLVARFETKPLLDVLRPLCLRMDLPADRTPRLLLRVQQGDLPREDGRIQVPRGRKPWIPEDWLKSVYLYRL